jgi:hypothetical protein
MGPFDTYGFSEQKAREFLERELGRVASSSSFYWESDELEEALDIIVDAVARTIAANNRELTADIQNRALGEMRIPP